MTIYLNNIPTGIVKLSQDYLNIKNNFSQLDITYGVNHVPFSVALNNGLHTVVNMVNNVAKPTIIDNTGALYTRPFSGGGNTDLWYTPDASGYEYQMTRTTENAGVFSLFATNTNYQAFAPPRPSQFGGWSFLPGGLIIQYGTTANTNLNSNFQIKFPFAFTTFVGSVVITAYDSVSTDKSFVINSGSVNLTGFAFRLSSSNQPEGAYWMAIGV